MNMSTISLKYYFELHRLASIRRFLTSTATANPALCEVIQDNHTSRVTALANCKSEKHMQNRLFVLPLSLHHHISLICCKECHHTPATLAPAHTPCLFSIYLHTVRQHFEIASFPLPLLLSGTPFQIDVRCVPSLSSLKSSLKTYLFRSVYKN